QLLALTRNQEGVSFEITGLRFVSRRIIRVDSSAGESPSLQIPQDRFPVDVDRFAEIHVDVEVGQKPGGHPERQHGHLVLHLVDGRADAPEPATWHTQPLKRPIAYGPQVLRKL